MDNGKRTQMRMRFGRGQRALAMLGSFLWAAADLGVFQLMWKQYWINLQPRTAPIKNRTTFHLLNCLVLMAKNVEESRKAKVYVRSSVPQVRVLPWDSQFWNWRVQVKIEVCPTPTQHVKCGRILESQNIISLLRCHKSLDHRPYCSCWAVSEQWVLKNQFASNLKSHYKQTLIY